MNRVPLLLVMLVMLRVAAGAQTNPAAQLLPYMQDFDGLAHSSTMFPDGWQGWSLGTSASTSFRLSGPTGDVSLSPNSSASTTVGGVHNFNGKIGFLPTGSLDPALVLSVATTGATDVKVKFDIMTIRNPYNGTTNTRINQVDLQYRVGITGNFTSVSGLINGIYENNTTAQTGSGVTTPQHLQTVTLSLPAACDNQPVVQLRWAQRDFSGSGSRSSFAVDNIVVGTQAQVINHPSDHTVCNGDLATFSASADGNPIPTIQWQMSTNNGTTWTDLSGETNTSLSFVANLSQSGNQYRAVFTNHFGSATTHAATLLVNAPSVGGMTSAADGTICSGSSTAITLTAHTGDIQKWQSSTDGGSTWNDLASTNNPLITGPLAQTTMFRAEVKDGVCPAVFSTAASVTVDAAPVGGTATPADTTVPSGSGTTITLTGYNGAIQWQTSADGITFSDLAGATSASVATGPLTVTTHFRAVVTNGVCPSAISTVATVSVGSTTVFGSISGTVSRSGGGALEGVIVKLLDNGMLPLADVVTDNSGGYNFSGLTVGSYNIMIVEPLGYLADANPKPASVVDATPVDVDFSLSQLLVANNARKRPYWKHQFDVHVRGHGRFDETAAQLQSYIARVQQHYTPHFNVFASTLSLSDWQDALSRDRNIPPYIDKALMELAALVLNLASLKVGQYTVATEDNRTAGEVLTYVSQLFTDPDATRRDYTKARELAKKVNEGKRIRAGEIPASSILYKGRELSWGFGVPTTIALYDNYPNPFNSSTTIVYDVPSERRITLNVYNSLGQEIATLVDGTVPAGRYFLEWKATAVASGMYFYKMISGSFVQTKKMILLH